MENTELRAIPFVQLIGGEKRAVKFMTSPEVSAKALAVIEAGYQYRVAYYGQELHLSCVQIDPVVIGAPELEVALVILSIAGPAQTGDHDLGQAVRRLVEGFTPEAPNEYCGA